MVDVSQLHTVPYAASLSVGSDPAYNRALFLPSVSFLPQFHRQAADLRATRPRRRRRTSPSPVRARVAWLLVVALPVRFHAPTPPAYHPRRSTRFSPSTPSPSPSQVQARVACLVLILHAFLTLYAVAGRRRRSRREFPALGASSSGGMAAALPRDASESASYTYINDDEEVDMETTCPGQRFTRREERKIRRQWENNYFRLCGEHSARINQIIENEGHEASFSSVPPAPFKVLPETTELCIERGYCYHREYMTNDTSETSRALGDREPRVMLQVLSLRLSRNESCPISVYGTFAVRDDWEPLRNYIFNRTRDDPIVIDKGSFALPLCSPCRGMYVVGFALLEVDLWIKNEEDRSADERLLSVYAEIELRSCFNTKCSGRIYGDRCMLDMDYIFLTRSVAAIIQVSSLADSSNHVRFTALNSSFDDEIMLYEGKGIEKGKLIEHVVAVKDEGKLQVRLELGDSVFVWTFQDGITSSPGDLIENQFQVRIFFSPSNIEPVLTRYFDWQIRCREYKRKLSYAG